MLARKSASKFFINRTFNRYLGAGPSSPVERLVIIGGVAGGATAAARATRLNNHLDVTVIERSPDVSFANCGLPYHIGREIEDRGRLVLQTPASLSASLGVKVKTKCEVIKINRDAKTVTIRDVGATATSDLPYDRLIVSTGASPLKPPVSNIDHPRVMCLRNLDDMDAIDKIVHASSCQSIAVIGAGFIGLEVAEQLRKLNKTVYLVEKASAVLPQADEEMASFLHTPLQECGVQMTLGDGLKGFESSSSGDGKGVIVHLESGKTISADLVVLSVGVRPESWLAKDAGLQLNQRGYIAVNDHMQTSDPAIYAVGDVIETKDLVFPQLKATVALGNIANMQARIAADHMILGTASAYRGSLGTSIVRVEDNVLAITGWTEKRLKAAGIPYSTTTITANNHASYYPNALPITLKVTFDPATGRVFGAQAFGVEGVDKRIDAIAMAITGGLSVEDLALAQLCYSPPFGSARDVVNVAGLAARNIQQSLVFPAYSLTDPAPSAATGSAAAVASKPVQLVDVRPAENAKLHPIPGSINIPYATVKAQAAGLDPSKEYRTVCALGKTAYFASRQLLQAGLTSTTLIGGLRLYDKPKPVLLNTRNSSTSGSTASAQPERVHVLDCSGLACPGPLLKLRDSLNNMDSHSVLRVKATDPGFKADVKAFAASNGLQLRSLKSEKGVIEAELVKMEAAESVGDGSIASAAAAASSSSSSSSNSRKGATLVVFSQDFDKVLGSFIIANGAAAMGGEVTMFFTFWGLNVLRSPNKSSSKPKQLLDAMFGAMMPKGIDKLPLGNMNFGGMGPVMLKHTMNAKHLPNLPDLIASAKAANIRLVACTMSMEAMGITAEELMEGVELGGVAEYLGAAEKSGTNLFI